MNCPVCKIELKLSDRQGIEIDYCSQCRGVWLDRGELDKIIERSVQPTQSFHEPVREEHHSNHYDQYEHKDNYRKHKKKSLLGELFDFD